MNHYTTGPDAKKASDWICSCRRKNSPDDNICVFCQQPRPEGKKKDTEFRPSNNYPTVQRGDYECSKGTVYFRSKWEANYALYMDFLVENMSIKEWEYEADVFVFNEIKFGTRSYKPDFKVFNNNGSIEYHEVKGHMDSQSKTKLKRMHKYYPSVKIVLVERKEYQEILKKLTGVIKFY